MTWECHYTYVIMGAMASHITSLTIVYSSVYSGADQRKHQSSASLAFVWGIHWWPANSPQKWPATRKIFPFDDVIMPFPLLVLCVGNSCHKRPALCCFDSSSCVLACTSCSTINRVVGDLRLYQTKRNSHDGDRIRTITGPLYGKSTDNL